ncbi:MAG: hypothetical protein JOZ19_07545 [Rubrobacter sp.]|nr:hypothetical protein [Rubrobacter sp.]
MAWAKGVLGIQLVLDQAGLQRARRGREEYHLPHRGGGISERDTALEIAVKLRQPYRRIKNRHSWQQCEAYYREVVQLVNTSIIASIKAHAKEIDATSR